MEKDSKANSGLTGKALRSNYQGLPLAARAESREHVTSLFFAILIVKIQTLVGKSNYVAAKDFSIPKSFNFVYACTKIVILHKGGPAYFDDCYHSQKMQKTMRKSCDYGQIYITKNSLFSL